jgi:hypothetical protein
MMRRKRVSPFAAHALALSRATPPGGIPYTMCNVLIWRILLRPMEVAFVARMLQGLINVECRRARN